jgi:tryptophanyl-tRNA synthetase
VVPEALLGDVPVLLGLDGRKMSKSLRNGIYLRDSPDQIARKVRLARTDSKRHITFEPNRRPEIASLLRIAGLCTGRSPESIAAEIGDSGARSLKDLVVTAVGEFLRPMRQRGADVTRSDAQRILDNSAVRADVIADETMRQVREAMGMTYAELTGTRLALNMNM